MKKLKGNKKILFIIRGGLTKKKLGNSELSTNVLFEKQKKTDQNSKLFGKRN